MSKQTDAEIELRIATLFEMTVKGCSRAYIVRYCSENYEISERHVDTYLSKVKELIKKTYGQEYKETILSNHLAQLENLYEKNYTIEDFRECRNIIDSRNKLLGLNAPTEMKQNSVIEYIQLSKEEREERIRELIRKANVK